MLAGVAAAAETVGARDIGGSGAGRGGDGAACRGRDAADAT